MAPLKVQMEEAAWLHLRNWEIGAEPRRSFGKQLSVALDLPMQTGTSNLALDHK